MRLISALLLAALTATASTACAGAVPRRWQPRRPVPAAVRPAARPAAITAAEVARALRAVTVENARQIMRDGGGCTGTPAALTFPLPEYPFYNDLLAAMRATLLHRVDEARIQMAARAQVLRVAAVKRQMAAMGLPGLTPANVDLVKVVRHGAAVTGADPAMLLSIAWTESLFNPQSTTTLSSATGPFQFTFGGWLTAVHEFGDRYGMGHFASRIDRLRNGVTVGTRLSPVMAAQMFTLRADTWTSSLMTGENIKRDTAGLRTFLGRTPNAADIYLTHVLGYGGALNFIRVVQTEPKVTTDVAIGDLNASNNPSLFMRGGEYLSVADAYTGIRATMESQYKVFSEVLAVGPDSVGVPAPKETVAAALPTLTGGIGSYVVLNMSSPVRR